MDHFTASAVVRFSVSVLTEEVSRHGESDRVDTANGVVVPSCFGFFFLDEVEHHGQRSW